jgi:hypothetical protein
MTIDYSTNLRDQNRVNRIPTRSKVVNIKLKDNEFIPLTGSNSTANKENFNFTTANLFGKMGQGALINGIGGSNTSRNYASN